ncbi:MAG: ABC transporter permease [Pseudomonadota bacterium]
MVAGVPTRPAPLDATIHVVSDEPFNPGEAERDTAMSEDLAFAGQWRLVWLKLKQHRLAIVSAVILLLLYLMAIFAEPLAPYAQDTRNSGHVLAPPQAIHLFHDGEFIGPFVYGYTQTLDMENLQRVYTPNPDKVQPLRFFCEGDRYQFWGLFEASGHLVCPAVDGTLFLLGTDRLGRDVLSRIIYGARISLTVGLIGIAVSLFLGILIGGLAGYFGGWVDGVVQRVIETIRSLPELPLWMALSAAVPVSWSPILVFFSITIILGLIDWTGLARAVRSKLLALREEDFASAARLLGAKPRRIIFKHLVPNFSSHIIASATLAIPSMILGETALSYLGLGLRPPINSWGVLLTEAQDINIVVLYPWLMLPVVPVIIAILAFNFLGDGLRDAADPYR